MEIENTFKYVEVGKGVCTCCGEKSSNTFHRVHKPNGNWDGESYCIGCARLVDNGADIEALEIVECNFYQEQLRIVAVKKSLAKQIFEMFYGGNHPSLNRLQAITNAFSRSREYRLSKIDSMEVAKIVHNKLK